MSILALHHWNHDMPAEGADLSKRLCAFDQLLECPSQGGEIVL